MTPKGLMSNNNSTTSEEIISILAALQATTLKYSDNIRPAIITVALASAMSGEKAAGTAARFNSDESSCRDVLDTLRVFRTYPSVRLVLTWYI